MVFEVTDVNSLDFLDKYFKMILEISVFFIERLVL